VVVDEWRIGSPVFGEARGRTGIGGLTVMQVGPFGFAG
jgi:hypothetical protein